MMAKRNRAFLLAIAITLSACGGGPHSLARNGPYAPGVNRQAKAVDQLLVGHRLMVYREHELALAAFHRAALDRGLDGDVLSALGSANLALGRLGQAETLLRRAAKKEDSWPEVWNNLGVVLLEKGETPEAAGVFRKAYALDNGESDAIRDNLRLALARMDNVQYDQAEKQNYKIMRRGTSDYLIRSAHKEQ